MNTKKRKRKKYNIISILSLLCIIVGIIILIFYFLDLNKNNDSKPTNNNTNNDINSGDISKDDIWSQAKQQFTFFKEEYKDRYINYKNNNPQLTLEKVIIYINIGIDQNFYTNIKESPNQYKDNILVNKFYSISSGYVPKNLETIDANFSAGNRLMEQSARIAFEKMAKAAKDEGFNIRAVSTYRSYNYQQNLYNNYVKADGKDKADTYSARAGYSEHQTGLAVDVDNKNSSYTSFGLTKEFNWMKDNSYKYGFILRYTKDNEFITGYKDEPWHYRYVGIDIATYIYENPMTYEEYYVRFLNK